MNAVEEKVIKKYTQTIELSDSLKVPLLNWGYWPDELSIENVEDRSDASLKLIAKIVQEAEIFPQHQVLDVGCGPGGTSINIYKMSGCQHVTGVDICGSEIAYAKKNLQAKPELFPFVSYEEMNATKLQYNKEQFDRLIAVECAFHFHYRKNFLKETLRVLKLGGRLVLTDWIKGQSTSEGNLNRTIGNTALKFWGIPEENIIDSATYSKTLEELGFKNVQITSIADRVIPYYIQYISSKKGKQELLKTTGRTKTWTYMLMLQVVLFLYKRSLVDYVLVKADK